MAKTKRQKSLSNWTRQKWDYVSPSDKKKPKGKRGRYLPASVRAVLVQEKRQLPTGRKRKLVV